MSSRVLVFYGGFSPEHEVSCVSACFICKILVSEGFSVLPTYIDHKSRWHLQKSVFKEPSKQLSNPCFLHRENQRSLVTSDNRVHEFDIVFPIIHGRTGEDGSLQGMLEFLNIPYVGAGIFTSSVCMDKYYAKTLLNDAKFPVVPYARIDQSDWSNWPNQVKNEIFEKFSFPLFVKPCNMGSSIGISKVKSMGDFDNAVHLAFMYDHQVIIEKSIDAKELEIGIMGNHPNYKVTNVGEIFVKSEFYSYKTKYISNQADLKIPADITQKQRDIIRDMATAVFGMLRGDGFARIDFFLEKTGHDKIYMNEINTLPGFTPISMFPKLWEYSGIKPNILISNLVDLGFQKFSSKKKLKNKL